MRKLLFIGCLAALASCNNAGSGEAAKKDSAAANTATEKKTIITMPYELDRPYQNWQTGDPQHAATAMTGLKAFEDGDIAACVKNFGDTVDLRFDGFRARLSNDSLLKHFTNERNMLASFKVYMSDWESVISEDKKEEWVTLWYKQVMTDKKGKTDSVSVVDDCKIENDKIVLLDEKTQHYPKK